MTNSDCCGPDSKWRFPYLAFIPVITSLAAVLVLILRCRRRVIPIEKPKARPEKEKSILLPEELPAPEEPKADDLTVIEGIGQKVSSTLAAAGIHQFSQLAQFTPEVIKGMLVKAGNRISDPTTWPEQARLAATGKWEQLKKFQAKLKGGRRV